MIRNGMFNLRQTQHIKNLKINSKNTKNFQFNHGLD
jgi:hypothetical protein